MKHSYGLQWKINQAVILLFGLFMAFQGYRIFKDRQFLDYHFGIMVDFGEYHRLWGGALIAIGTVIGLYAAFEFWRKRRS